MCVVLPVAAQAALTIASGVANYAAQAKAARQQERAQYQASLNELKRYQHEASAERLNEAQEDTADAFEAQKAQREAQEAISTLMTSAEERGVEGNASGLAVAHYMQANANYQTALERQARMRSATSHFRLRGAGLGFTQNMVRINRPINRPNLPFGDFAATVQDTQSIYQADALRGMQEGLYAQQANLRQSQQGLAAQNVGIARQGAGLSAERARRFRIGTTQRIAGGR